MYDSEYPTDEDVLNETYGRATYFVTCNASVMNQDDLLYFYGRYKQVDAGPCSAPMPGILKFRSRNKWSSWNSLGNMTKEEAMQQYVDRLTFACPDWDVNKPKDTREKKNFGPVNSSCLNTDPVLEEGCKTIFDFIKEGNCEKVKSLISTDAAVKCVVDDGGLSLLHWACDRGHSDIVNLLISSGVDLNSQDNDGQTPLHYASSCGHENVVKLLLNSGAKADIFDSDGLSPADVAYSTALNELFTKRTAQV